MMTEYSQFEFIEKILMVVMPFAKIGWREMIIDYYAEDSIASSMSCRYLIERDGKIYQRCIVNLDEVYKWMRKLQAHLAQAGRPEFTRCKIHIKADGKYETAYEYDKIDLRALPERDWDEIPSERDWDEIPRTGRA